METDEIVRLSRYDKGDATTMGRTEDKVKVKHVASGISCERGIGPPSRAGWETSSQVTNLTNGSLQPHKLR
jgi:hypothetical protein